MKIIECINRNEFVKTMENIILTESSETFQFLGKNGVGKKYVLEQLENKLSRKCEIYRIVSDTLMKKGKQISTHTFNVAFSLNCFIGMSLTPTKNETLKLHYIISNLKSLSHKKIILISALDYDILPAESRAFIDVLLCNKCFIEEKVKKNITVILTSTHDYFDGKYKIINAIFNDYNYKDIYAYLTEYCKFPASQITDKKIQQIYKLCGTNFNLIKNYAEFIINGDESNNTLEGIVDTKLNYYIKSGCSYNLTKEELKTILYSSSISIHMLTPQMISQINSIKEQSVVKGFSCAVNEKILEEDKLLCSHPIKNYSFCSQEEKKCLYQIATSTYPQDIASYYIYLSDVAEDEYFERAQYLTQYYGVINDAVFTLLILAISKCFLLNDSLEKRRVISFFIEYNKSEKNKKFFNTLINIYELHYQNEYKKSNDILSRIDLSDFNAVLIAELRRLEFKNAQLGHMLTKHEMHNLSLELQGRLTHKLFLINDFLPQNKDEKILSLRIIFELAPFILDSQNDKKSFLKLYDNSLLFVQYIQNHFIKKSFAEYVINVFNRKAFLFAVPSQATLYYEQAVGYFKGKKIWTEYVVALASKAGNDIALHKYKLAKENCKEALSVIKKYELDIPQQGKIYNNLYIAEFLAYECKEEKTLTEVQEKAIHTAKKLEKLLTPKSCGMNHVILTNISGLYLYAHKEKKYYHFKERLETSLRCKDVSNVYDEKINDFYRYHFGWYEFYINLKNKNWVKCKQIVESLKAFYPSIFHNIEKMNLRVNAAQNLIDSQFVPSIRDYGFNILQYAPSDKGLYMSRGLPLSDLQFTSWE